MILIAEDEEFLREAYQAHLSSKNCQSICFCTAEEAWKYLEEQGESVSLLITDLQMPGKWGSWLVERVNEGFPGIPTILISGTPELCDQSIYDAIIPKPFTMDQLWSEVQRLLQKSKITKGDKIRYSE